MKFKAAILERLNSPLEIKEVESGPLQYGQVLVKVYSSGICGAQIGEITGAKGPDKYLPHLLGHEGGGEVIEIGPGVKTVKPNDRVVMHWRKGSGIEAEPPKYTLVERGDIIGAGPIASFAEYAIVSENRLTSVRSDLPFDIAALMGCSLTTAFGMINNEVKLKIGQSIAICGCGGVGLHVVLASHLVGAGKIIAIDQYQSKLDMAKSLGADETINTQDGDLHLIDPFDVFVDCTGNTELIVWGYARAKKIILVGQPKHDKDLVFRSMRQYYCGKVMLDSEGGKTDPAIDIPRYADMYMQDKFKNLQKIITHYVKLEQINTVVDLMKSGDAIGKCIIRMNQ